MESAKHTWHVIVAPDGSVTGWTSCNGTLTALIAVRLVGCWKIMSHRVGHMTVNANLCNIIVAFIHGVRLVYVTCFACINYRVPDTSTSCRDTCAPGPTNSSKFRFVCYQSDHLFIVVTELYERRLRICGHLPPGPLGSFHPANWRVFHRPWKALKGIASPNKSTANAPGPI
jgi:hypothetical protein